MASDIDGDDLDAELLAVTATRGVGGESSGSEGLYEGEAESSDSDGMDIAKSDRSEDEESDAYSADEDEDDADYGAKTKSKRRTKGGKKTGAKAAKSGGSKAASAKTGGKRKVPKRKLTGVKRKREKEKEAEEEEESEEVFTHEFDREGYKDEEDRKKLMQMNELDRETLLMERMEERRKAEELWNMKKRMEQRGMKKGARASNRTKVSAKSSALQALKEHKAKKSMGVQKSLDISDDSEESYRGAHYRKRFRESDAERSSPQGQDLARRAPEARPFEYRDLVYSDNTTTPLYLRRTQLEQMITRPNGPRVVKGLFVKLNVGTVHGKSSYRLCQIVGTEDSKIYKLTNDVINKKVILKIGNETASFFIYMISNKHPTEEEFAAWHRKMREHGLDLMSRKEVKELMIHARKAVENRLGETDEEVKAHIANMELLHPERVNWTTKKALLKAEMEQIEDEIKAAEELERLEEAKGFRNRDTEEDFKEVGTRKSQKLREKLERLEAQLERVKSNEEEYGRGRARNPETSVFADIAKKNQMLNDEVTRAAVKKGSNGRAVDVFSRLSAGGGSYFGLDGKAKKEPKLWSADATDTKMPNGSPFNAYQRWQDMVSLGDFQTMRPRKISDNPLLEEYGMEFSGLEIFELSEAELRSRFPLRAPRPPGVDSVYAYSKQEPKPQGRIMTFDTWMQRLNQAGF